MSKTIKLTTEESFRASSIMHAIEIASNFQLYSYHIISHEVFVKRTIELTQLFAVNTKNP